MKNTKILKNLLKILENLAGTSIVGQFEIAEDIPEEVQMHDEHDLADSASPEELFGVQEGESRVSITVSFGLRSAVFLDNCSS